MGKRLSKHNDFCDPLQVKSESWDKVFFSGSTLIKPSDLSEEQCQQILILPVSSLVLFPGQILPLNLFDAREVSIIRNASNGDKAVGILTTKWQNSGTEEVMSSVGCTAEILSDVDHDSSETLKVKTIGRQRFRVVSMKRQLDGRLLATVHTVLDRALPQPLEGTMSVTLWRLKRSHDASYCSATSRAAGVKQKVSYFSSAYCTAWPPWVYQQYDANWLIDEISRHLAVFNVKLLLEVDSRRSDSASLSLWLAANLPFNDQLKLQLLGMQSPIKRLRCELNFLAKCTVLCCKDCSVLIAKTSDVFTVSVAETSGPLAIHVNPGGVVSELVTVTSVSAVSLSGFPVLQDTWYPGYAWTVLNCASCAAHVGWRFTRVPTVSSSIHGAPRTFWGICRSSILPAVSHSQHCNITEDPDVGSN